MSFVIGVTESGKSWIASDGKSVNHSTGEINHDVKKVLKINNIVIGYTRIKETCQAFINRLSQDDKISAKSIYTKLCLLSKEFEKIKPQDSNAFACFLIIGEDEGLIKHFLISTLTNQFIIEDCVDNPHISFLCLDPDCLSKYNASVKRAFDKKFKSDYYRMKLLLTHISKFDDSVNNVPYIEISDPS